MKIGIVTILFERGQSYLGLDVIKALQWAGHETFVYARTGGVQGKAYLNTNVADDSILKNLSTYPTHSIPPEIFKVWIKENKLDGVILIEEQWQEEDLAKAARDCGVKVFGIPMYEYLLSPSIAFFKSYHKLICPVKCCKDKLDKLGFDTAVHIPWGMDREIFKPDFRKLDDTPVRMVHISGWGGFRKRRGTEETIKAFKESKCVDGARLLITRQTHDNFKTSGWVDGIKVEYGTMPREEIIKRYQASDVMIAPSRFTGLGLTLLEAMNCGVPVVTVDAEPMNEHITKMTGAAAKVREFIDLEGVYVKSAEVDVLDMGKILKRFSKMDKKELQEIKQATSDYASEHLDWRKNSKKLVKLIEETINE